MVGRILGMLQIDFEIGPGLVEATQVGQRQPTIAPLAPVTGQQDHQPLEHLQQARPVGGLALDVLQVAQHARQDLTLWRRLQIELDRRLELVDQAMAAPERLEPLGQVLASQRLAGEGVDHDLALGQADLDQEMARKIDPACLQAQALGEL